jgi:hypothetical protein
MTVTLHRRKVLEAVGSPEHSGRWYPDPYGTAARRWYDNISGWSEHVEKPGHAPDKTGLARIDEAAVSLHDSTQRRDADGKHVPLSRPVDPQYMANARPVR